MKIKKIGIALCSISLLTTNLVFANNLATTREECYNTLKENLTEIGIFKEAEKEFKDLNYPNFEKKLSRNYKNMSSFGIDVDEAIFEQNVYSFGKQTGYMHPPFSPFPTYEKAEKWENPAKQNIYTEEFVKDEMGKIHFLSCGFIRTEAENLMNITSENYLYDGELISVLKKDKNQKYKAWYSENTSYNHENKPFVSWQRLFVYPSSSVNSYFNRFNIAEAFPANPSDTLDLFQPKKVEADSLSPELLKLVKEKTDKEIPAKEDIMSVLGDGVPRVYVANKDGQIKTSMARKELMPVKLPENTVFGLKSYYDGIENYFPTFAKHLALRGVIKYDTLKKLISHKDAPEFAHIWSTVLDTREITKYALLKKQGKIEIDPDNFYEKSLQNIPNMEKESQKILGRLKVKNKNLENLKNTKTEKIKFKNEVKEKNKTFFQKYLFHLIGLSLFIIASFLSLFAFKKLKK